MRPIDVRKLEHLWRFRMLRTAYLGSLIETSSADRRGYGASGERTDGRDNHCDPRT